MSCSYDIRPKPEISLIALHLSKAGIKGNSLPAVFEDSDDDQYSQQSNSPVKRTQTILSNSMTSISDKSDETDESEELEENQSDEIADEPHLSFIISKPVPSTSKSTIAYSAPQKTSKKIPAELTLSSSLPCVNQSTEQPQRKNSKPPSVWCHKLNNDEMDQQFTNSEPNMFYNLLRTFSVPSMPALSTSATTATTASTPITTQQKRKSSFGSLPIRPSSIASSNTAFSPIKLLSDKFSKPTSSSSSSLSPSTKADQSVLVDTTNATAKMIKYDAQVERRKMSEDKTVWRRLGEYFVEVEYNSAERLNYEILQEERYPDSLSERLRKVKARWSLSISGARSEARQQALQLLKEARKLYKQTNPVEFTNNLSMQHQKNEITAQNNGKTPRCDHCFKMHWGGPYECELNQQIRANRAYEREKRRRKAWVELHLTALRLNVGPWDKIDCPHPLSHIKNFEYGADLCNSSVMSTKTWLEIQGDTDRERKESLSESREFDFCLDYLAQFHSSVEKKYVSVSNKRPRASI